MNLQPISIHSRHSRKTSRALNQEPEERLNQRYSPIDGDEKGQPASGSQELEMFAADRYTPPPYSTTSPLYEDDGEECQMHLCLTCTLSILCD